MRAIGTIAVFACACGRIGFGNENSTTGGIGGDDGPVGTPGDVAPANACSTTIALSDDFTSPTPLPMWTASQAPPDATLSQGSGELTISFAPTAHSNASAGLTLATPTSFVDACAVFDVRTVPNQTAYGATAVLSIGSGGASGHVVRFLAVATGLQSVCIIGSNNQPHVDVRPYDPVAHRFLRLRNNSTSGLWYWEASPDGTTFTTLGSHSCSSVMPASSQLYIEASTTSGDVNTGSAVFGKVTVYR